MKAKPANPATSLATRSRAGKSRIPTRDELLQKMVPAQRKRFLSGLARIAAFRKEWGLDKRGAILADDDLYDEGGLPR